MSNNGTIFNEMEQNDEKLSVGTTTPGISMSLMSSVTDTPKAGITYKISNGGGDETTAPGRTVTYWNSSVNFAIKHPNYDKSNVGALAIRLHTIITSVI